MLIQSHSSLLLSCCVSFESMPSTMLRTPVILRSHGLRTTLLPLCHHAPHNQLCSGQLGSSQNVLDHDTTSLLEGRCHRHLTAVNSVLQAKRRFESRRFKLPNTTHNQSPEFTWSYHLVHRCDHYEPFLPGPHKDTLLHPCMRGSTCYLLPCNRVR
jgi:hypothetical protein